MSADDIEIARQFWEARDKALETGDRELAYAFLAEDIEWVTPRRTLRGLDELKEKISWGSPLENLDLEAEGDWVDLGDGRVALDRHVVYRWKETGELAYERDVHLELTIRDRKIARYEMRSDEG